MFRLKSDLYRNFAIGFLIGAGIVAVQLGPDGWSDIAPQAHAAVAQSVAK